MADTANFRVLNVSARAGTARVFAGTSAAGYSDGPVSTSAICGPQGVVWDGDSGGAILTDFCSNSPCYSTSSCCVSLSNLRKVQLGVTSTIGRGAWKDSCPAFVCSAASESPTFSYSCTSSGYQDGDLYSASFNNPQGLALDQKDPNSIYTYVADSSNNRIRRVLNSPPHSVTTIAGSTASFANVINGDGTSANFYSPTDITSDNNGQLWCVLIL